MVERRDEEEEIMEENAMESSLIGQRMVTGDDLDGTALVQLLPATLRSLSTAERKDDV